MAETEKEEHSFCAFVIQKKNRQCRLAVKKGQRYCGEHSFAGNDEQAAMRIPCPLDPKHTINSNDLKKHLKRCNSRLPKDPWISENINKSNIHIRQSHEWPWIDKEFASKVEKVYGENCHQIAELHLSLPSIEKELERQDIGPISRKYLIQQSSIAGHLVRLEVLSPLGSSKTCFVEFGAGRAQLISWLALELSGSSNEFLVIDRAGTRNKFENKLVDLSDCKINRIRCGIEHLDLSNVPSVQNASRIVALCKHVCGCASDFSLRCVSSAFAKGINIEAVVFAPCCHNKTEQSQFTGNEFLRSKGFNSEQFPALKMMASWATCGITRGKRSTEDTYLDRDPRYSFTPEEKEELGRKTKFLLELGRAEFLRKSGFHTKLYYYVPYSVTPENILIVATKSE